MDGPDRSTPRALANGDKAQAPERGVADPLEAMLRDEPDADPAPAARAPVQAPISDHRRRERDCHQHHAADRDDSPASANPDAQCAGW